MDTLIVVGLQLLFPLLLVGFVVLLARSFQGAARAQQAVLAGLQQRLPDSAWTAEREGMRTTVEGRTLRIRRWSHGDRDDPVHHELTLDLTGLVDALLHVAGPSRGLGDGAPPDFTAHFSVSDALPLMQDVLSDAQVQASLLRLARAGTKVGILSQHLHADRVDLPWEPEQVHAFVQEALAVAQALSRAGHALVQARAG
jgi:hypothetical protein